MRDRKPRAAVLLGAGSSIPAGYPTTDELTRRVLSGNGASRHTDGTFYLSGTSVDTRSEHVKVVAATVNAYQAEIESFFRRRYGRPVNYEDLYYLASQLADHEEGELDNPGLCRLLQHFGPQFVELIRRAALSDITTLRDLLRETANYIFDIVWRSLVISPSQTIHLRPIEYLYRSARFDRIALATLCHDTHLETFLASREINLIDGFSRPERGVRYWTPPLLRDDSNNPLLLKLHGSVDWFRLRPDNGTWYEERIGIPVDGDYEHARDSCGRLQTPVPARPLFLVGTFNKIADYSQEVFGALFSTLRDFLSSVDRVAVCGYGFGDKGINAALINWLYSRPDRHLAVVHRDPDVVRGAARGAIANKWDEWRRAGCLHTIEKWLEELDEDELEAWLAG